MKSCLLISVNSDSVVMVPQVIDFAVSTPVQEYTTGGKYTNPSFMRIFEGGLNSQMSIPGNGASWGAICEILFHIA